MSLSTEDIKALDQIIADSLKGKSSEECVLETLKYGVEGAEYIEGKFAEMSIGLEQGTADLPEMYEDKLDPCAFDNSTEESARKRTYYGTINAVILDAHVGKGAMSKAIYNTIDEVVTPEEAAKVKALINLIKETPVRERFNKETAVSESDADMFLGTMHYALNKALDNILMKEVYEIKVIGQVAGFTKKDEEIVKEVLATAIEISRDHPVSYKLEYEDKRTHLIIPNSYAFAQAVVLHKGLYLEDGTLVTAVNIYKHMPDFTSPVTVYKLPYKFEA